MHQGCFESIPPIELVKWEAKGEGQPPWKASRTLGKKLQIDSLLKPTNAKGEAKFHEQPPPHLLPLQGVFTNCH